MIEFLTCLGKPDPFENVQMSIIKYIIFLANIRIMTERGSYHVGKNTGEEIIRPWM